MSPTGQKRGPAVLTALRARRAQARDAGSMPLALFIVVMVIVVSLVTVSVIAYQIAQNRASDTNRYTAWALDSATNAIAEQLGTAPRTLVDIPSTEPSTWQVIDPSKYTYYRWWISQSMNAISYSSSLGENFTAATYGNSTWVATSASGKVYTSTDGLTWTNRGSMPDPGSGATYSKMTYGLGKFIAVPSYASTKVATSADGITWTLATLPASGSYLPACSASTCVFLRSTAATGYYTSNLSAFTALTTPFTASSVVYGGTRFVMSGAGGSGTAIIASSLDGISWTSRYTATSSWAGSIVAARGSLWVVAEANANGSAQYVYSTDGAKTWTLGDLGFTGNWTALVPAGTQLVLVSGPIDGVPFDSYIGSADGVSWTQFDLPAARSWTGAASRGQAMLIYPSTGDAYLVPTDSALKNPLTLEATARVQVGKITSTNNGQYLAKVTFSWDIRAKMWALVDYVAYPASAADSSPSEPLYVVAAPNAAGTVTVSWSAPLLPGSSPIEKYTAVATATGLSCPDGGTLSGSTCSLVTSAAANGGTGTWSCSSGTLSGSVCLTTSTYTAVTPIGDNRCISVDTSLLTCTVTNMETGFYTFKVTATNRSGTSGESAVSNVINPVPMSIRYPSVTFGGTQLSQTMTPIVENASATGTKVYSLTGTLPSGVTFNTATGVFTGPASWTGVTGFPFTVTVTVTDAYTGQSAAGTFTFSKV